MIRPLALACALAIFGTASIAQPYDDAALIRQIGFVAGQAVACGLDTADVAAGVSARLVDAMGYDDAASRKLVADGVRAAQAEGCRSLSEDQRRIFETTWARMKRRAGG